jgi:CHASE2 domain-containing sensor protein
LGLARRLDDLQIPQMIVMRELVPDEVAQKFLKYFLKTFASGKPLYLAAREARERLQGLESKFPCASWLPVIYQNPNPAAVPPTWEDLHKEPETKTKPLLWHRLLLVLLVSVVVSSVVMGMRSLGLLQSWELNAFDQLMRLRPAEKPDSRLLIVKITAEDIKKLGGEYPLHDRTVLRLLRKLEENQPRVIGLDFYRDRPEGEGHADLAKYLQKSEAQGASWASRIIPVCVVPSAKIPDGVAPPPGVSEEQLGFGDVVPDPDGIVRRHLLAMKPPAASSCSTFYALSFQLALHYLKADGISPKFISQNSWQLGPVVFKTLEAHTGFYHRQVGLQGFQLLLNYRSNQSPQEIAEQVTLTDVLNNRVKPDFVKDKIILIGVTDPTVEDNVNTPYNQEIRGLLLHAQMVSQILSAVEEGRSLLWFPPLWVDVFWVWAWSMVGGIITLHTLSSPLRLGVISTIAIISLNGICFIFLTKGGLLPLVPSALALGVTGGSIVAYRVFQTQRSQ